MVANIGNVRFLDVYYYHLGSAYILALKPRQSVSSFFHILILQHITKYPAQ